MRRFFLLLALVNIPRWSVRLLRESLASTFDSYEDALAYARRRALSQGKTVCIQRVRP